MNNKQNKRQSKKTFNGFWGALLMTFLITVAFGVLIYSMYMADIISVLDLSKLFDNNSDKQQMSHDNVYDALKEAPESVDYKVLYDVTLQELTEILLTRTSADTFTIKGETVNFGTGKDKAVSFEAKKEPDKFLVKKFDGGTVFETIERSNDVVTVTDNIRSRTAEHKYSDSFSFEACIGIPSLEHLISVCETIQSAKNDNIVDYKISLVSDSSKNYYHVEFIYTDISQKEEYFVSSENWMIENAYSYFGDKLYYRYTLTDYSES